MQPRDLPLILTKYVTVLTHLIIIFSHFSSKTIFCIIFSKHPHSTQSYTLLIQFQSHLSLLTIHILTNMVHCFKGYQHIINNKVVTRKSTLVFTLMWGNKRFSLLAKTLEASLDTTLLRLMGLYQVLFVGFFTFGISIMWVSLNFGRMIPWLRKLRTVCVTQLPTTDQ